VDERLRAIVQLLKKRLTTPPILVAPRDDGDFVLDMDAPEHALGAVLQQWHDGQLKVIAYVGIGLAELCPVQKVVIALPVDSSILGVVYIAEEISPAPVKPHSHCARARA